MRVLLGAESFLNVCKLRVRWHSKGKSYLPPKDLYDMAKKAIEDHQQTISARLRPRKAKKSQTAVLEIFCRALTSPGDGVRWKADSPKGQKPSVADKQKFNKSLGCINLIVNENSHPKSGSQSEPHKTKLETPEVFKCKNCSENRSVGARDLSNMIIANCKDCDADGRLPSLEAVLGTAMPAQQESNDKQQISVRSELSASSSPRVSKSMSPKQDAVAPLRPQESPSLSPLAERFAMPQKWAFPLGRNPCIDGKGDEKAKCPEPQGERKPPAKSNPPQGKSSTKSKARVHPPKSNVSSSSPVMPKKSPQPNNPPSEKVPPAPGVGFSVPLDSAFPPGRNPCTDGEKAGKKSKCAASKPEPKKSTSVNSSREREEQKASVNHERQQEKKAEISPKESSFSSGSSKLNPGPPASVEPEAKPTKQKSSRQGVINPEPLGSSVNANASRKPTHKPKSQSAEGKLPTLPSSSFSMPILSAFPMGRNPCRDGPRGASDKERQKHKNSPCGLAKVKSCQSETDSCASRKKTSGAAGCRSKASLHKKDAAGMGSPQENVKPADSLKSTPLAPKASSQEVSPPPPAAKTEQSSVPVDKETITSKDLSPPAPKAPSPPPAKEIKKPFGHAPAKSPSKPQSVRKNTGTECGAVKNVSPRCNKTKSQKDTRKCSELESPRSSESRDSNVKPELKRFPALPLKQSLASYISSIEPLLTEEEFKEEQKIAKKFAENEGAQLQELLEEEAERCSNWLTPRWTRSAYLTYQAPLTVFSSPGLSFPIQEFTEPNQFLNFTAKAIHAICEFKKLVDQDQIPVVKMGKNHLDNSQFCKIFGTVRKPGRFCDTIEQNRDADYVVVVYNNNYYKLPVYSESGQLLHVHSLTDALEKIYNCPIDRGEPFGLLTHDNRSNWAEAYTALCCPHGNADSVETIEQSLFLVCLDRCVPISKGKERIVQAHQLLHGGGLLQNSSNRWMDKTIQLIVNPNGLAGFCYEHSPADCQPLAMLMDFVQQKVNEENYGCDSCDSDRDIPFTLLKFQPVNECINLWLCQAMRNIQRIASQLQLNVFQFECHGKCFIKAQGLNPDSYIQMALSLAYHSMHKKIPAQYESAHLRIFREGRTETIRSTSNKSKAFVLAMESNTASSNEKLAALQSAVDAHEKLIKEAISGQGIDRHLFGLQQMALENDLPLPEFFLSKGFVRSVTFQLFTSQVATSHDGFMAFGPLLSDGYGVCYNPQEEKIRFAISAWKTCPEISPAKFAKAIKSSLNAMRRLVLETGGDCVGQNPCKCEKIRF
ncbi:choline O-acetyltransferase [Drosophila biarmipes]|uniref:choline O-acetyltransferase n=1 Tax=Drosophila biarmipes TaxID=125945 RepID=UPI0007E705F7|nr:choline O-acetyltransferase [Drosophila biarmipes]